MTSVNNAVKAIEVAQYFQQRDRIGKTVKLQVHIIIYSPGENLH